ncbi:MAG: glycosyltransferase family 39 protein [PVC group bacterium]
MKITERSASHVILLFLIIAAAFLRFYDLGGKSLWYDELYELKVAGKSIPYILKTTHPLHSPLNQIITGCFLSLGKNEFVLRLPSAVWGIAAVWAIYRVGRLFFGREEGLLSAFLLTLSSYHIRYSQEARMYAFFVLTTLLSLYFFWRAGRENKTLCWIGYVVSTALALYTHLFTLFLLLPQCVFTILGGFRGWKPRERGGAISLFRSPFFIALLAIGLLFLPRAITILSHPEVLKTYLRVAASAPRTGDEVSPVRVTPIGTILRLYGAGGGIPLYWYLFFLAAGIIAAFKESRRLLLFLLLLPGTPAIVFLFIKPGHIFCSRYLIFLLPVYYLFIARGVSGLAGLLGKRKPRVPDQQRSVRERSLVCLFCAGFLLCNINPLIHYYDNRDPDGNLIKPDWKALMHYLQDNARAGDTLFFSGKYPYHVFLALNHYLPATVKETVYHIDPETLEQAGIWWISARDQAPPFSPGLPAREIDEKIDGITAWHLETAVAFAAREIVNQDLGIDRGTPYGEGDSIPDNGIPDGWTAIDYGGGRENNYTVSIEENDTGPGIASFRLEDRVPEPNFVLQSTGVPVMAGRRFWVSALIQGAEIFWNGFSPCLSVRFLNENRQQISAPEQGLRILLDLRDGWGLCVINGLTPPGARFLKLALVEHKGYRGKVSKFRQVRLFGDW